MHKQLGKQKQGKKMYRWVSRACFRMYAHGQKIQHVGKDGLCVQRGSRAGIEGNQGAHFTFQYVKTTEKQQNKHGVKRKV